MKPGLLLVGGVFGSLLWGGSRELLPWTLISTLVWGLALRHGHRLAAVDGAGLWGIWIATLLGATVFSWEPLNSVLPFWKRATGAVLYLLACALWEPRDRRAWFWALCAAAPVLGAAAAWWTVPGYPWAGWLYPNPNYTASVQAAWFGALLGALAGGYRGRGGARLGMVLGMGTALGLIWASRSRGATVAAAAVVAVWAFRRNWKLTAALIPAALAVLWLGLPGSFQRRLLKPHDTSRYLRLEIWRSALQVARDEPWFGVGPGNFERGFALHNFPFEDSPPYENALSRYGKTAPHAHNELLHLAAEGGWGALALFLLALGRSVLRLGRRTGGWEEEAARMAALALFTHSLVDGVWMLPGLQLLFFSALAVGFPQPRRRIQAAGVSRVFGIGLAGAALAWLPEAGARYALERATRAAPGPEQVRWLEHALRVRPRDAWIWDRLARGHLLSSRSDPGRALAGLNRAIELEPVNAVFLVQKADLMARAGDRPRALELALRAVALEPDFAEARLLVAEEALRRGDRERGAQELGRVEEARRKLELALRANAHRGLSLHERLVFGIDEARAAALRRAAGH